ncbi:MAG TPA: PilZ domain-containing protein [Gammaproteobacteria bacterium]|nr:PilZ domain-containing protein [Gammaproteobacteria bacterium]
MGALESINRRFIRHPANIPVDIQSASETETEAPTECIRNISYGGLAIDSDHEWQVGDTLSMSIHVVEPAFDITGRVAWCHAADGHFELGIEFLDEVQGYRARMVEQVCQIEIYRCRILEQGGRKLTSKEAALEWIQRYAKSFPRMRND